MAVIAGQYFTSGFGESTRQAPVRDDTIANDSAPGAGDGTELDAVSERAIGKEVVDVTAYLLDFDFRNAADAEQVVTPAYVKEGSGVTFTIEGSGSTAGVVISAGAGAGPLFTSSVASPGPAFAFTVAADYKTAVHSLWRDNGGGTPIEMMGLRLYDDTTNEWAQLELSNDVASTSTVAIGLGRGFNASAAKTPGLHTPDAATPFGILVRPGAETGAAKGADVTIQGGEAGTGASDGGDAYLIGGPNKAATAGNTGRVFIQTPDQVAASSNTSGGVFTTTGAGDLAGGSGVISAITGTPGLTGTSGGFISTTGPGGATSGASGGYTSTTGVTFDGVSGGYSWITGNALGTSRDSGGFVFTVGTATGTRGTWAVSTDTMTWTAGSASGTRPFNMVWSTAAVVNSQIFQIADTTMTRLQLEAGGVADRTQFRIHGAFVERQDYLQNGTTLIYETVSSTSGTNLRTVGTSARSITISTNSLGALDTADLTLATGSCTTSGDAGDLLINLGDGGSASGNAGNMTVTSPNPAGSGTPGTFSWSAASHNFDAPTGTCIVEVGGATSSASSLRINDGSNLYLNINTSIGNTIQLEASGGRDMQLATQNSGSPGQIEVRAGDATTSANTGGLLIRAAGDGGLTGVGGSITDTTGSGGATSGDSGAYMISSPQPAGTGDRGVFSSTFLTHIWTASLGVSSGSEPFNFDATTDLSAGDGFMTWRVNTGAAAAILYSCNMDGEQDPNFWYYATTKRRLAIEPRAGTTTIRIEGQAVTAQTAANFILQGSSSTTTTNPGGNMTMSAGDGGPAGVGGNWIIAAGDGGGTSGDAGTFALSSPQPAGTGKRGAFSSSFLKHSFTSSEAAATNPAFEITNTDSGTTGVLISTFHNGTSQAAADVISQFHMEGESSTGVRRIYGRFQTTADVITNASEDATFEIAVMAGGTLTPQVTIDKTEVLFAAAVQIDGDLNHDGTNAGFFDTTPTTQPADIGALTLTTGTPDNTLVDVSGSGDDTTINNNFADLGDQINDIRSTVLQALGLMA